MLRPAWRHGVENGDPGRLENERSRDSRPHYVRSIGTVPIPAPAFLEVPRWWSICIAVHRRYTSLSSVRSWTDTTWLLKQGYSAEPPASMSRPRRASSAVYSNEAWGRSSLTRARLWACAPIDSQEDPNLAVDLVRQLARYCESELAMYRPIVLTRIEHEALEAGPTAAGPSVRAASMSTMAAPGAFRPTSVYSAPEAAGRAGDAKISTPSCVPCAPASRFVPPGVMAHLRRFLRCGSWRGIPTLRAGAVSAAGVDPDRAASRRLQDLSSRSRSEGSRLGPWPPWPHGWRVSGPHRLRGAPDAARRAGTPRSRSAPASRCVPPACRRPTRLPSLPPVRASAGEIPPLRHASRPHARSST